MISILSHDFIPVKIYVKDHTENFRHLLRMVLSYCIENGTVLMIEESLTKIIIVRTKTRLSHMGTLIGTILSFNKYLMFG